MKITIIINLIIWFLFFNAHGQIIKPEKLYTKSCDTVSIDSMICIKCTNAALTLGCKKYACDFKNHCIPMPVVPPKNKSKDIKTTLPGGTQKKG
ncbi:MAG: hypothetical protein IPO86_12565 [Saprospiraceae bacterium]|nr:hypothetical protein [Saprospiraceae bacterium]